MAFYAIALVTVVAALAVVTLPNLVYAALSLVVTFVGVAAIYVILSADFVAVVQVLIYAGAVTVLLLFAIMLTKLPSSRRGSPFNSQHGVALVVASLLFVVLAYVLTGANWAGEAAPMVEPSVEVIGRQLFSAYALPFEIASLLLLVAMVGAIILARED